MLGTHTKRDFGPICIYWSISTLECNEHSCEICLQTYARNHFFPLQPSFQCKFDVLEFVTPNPLPPIVCILSGHVSQPHFG